MIELERYRAQHRRLAAREAGLPYNQPRQSSAQQRAVRHHAEIRALPIGAIPSPLQDLTPGSPTFGHFFFLPNLSQVDGPDLVQ